MSAVEFVPFVPSAVEGRRRHRVSTSLDTNGLLAFIGVLA